MEIKKQEMLKQKEGITLIALTVTIVVLIVLASISINVLGGEDGLINQAKLAKKETEISEEKELLGRVIVQVVGKDAYGNIEEEALQKELDKEAGEGKIEVTDIGEEFEVIFKENNRYYIIDKDGNIGNTQEIIEDKNPGDITKDKDGNELDGSKEKPYEIWCIEDLVVFSNMVNGEGIKFENGNSVSINTTVDFSGKYIKLMRILNFKSKLSYANSERTDFGDINGNSADGNTLVNEMTTGTGFIPIGKETSKTFNGNFNGNNYSINSIYINTEKIGGLFGCTNEATIKNTTIKGEITSTKEKAGGIIRDAKKTNVEKCINYATIITTNDNPTYISDGGISYTNSYSGGIAGSLGNDGIVNECINYGKIITNKTYAAGIVAFCDGIIMNSINYGEIITQGSIAAGIASFKYSGRSEGTIIINCANYGNIKSPYIGGGIWGQQIAGKVFIYNSYNLGNIQSEQIAGGIYGKTYLTTTTNITNCYNEGIVYGKTSTGGILGYVYGGTLSITNSYYLDNVEKEIGNIEQGTSIKYSSTEKEIVLSGLNNYIDSNSEITNEWLHWKIEDNNIVYENINK